MVSWMGSHDVLASKIYRRTGGHEVQIEWKKTLVPINEDW